MKECKIQYGTGASAVILPEKGGTVVSYCVRGQEFFYRDDENLSSPERPRCGVPFLFPVFGRTPPDSPYPMEIHGFAHTSSWRVLSHTPCQLRTELLSGPETRKGYPFSFRVELTYSLEDGRLIIRQKYENLGTETMPYTFGFHPYFSVEDPETAEVSFRAAMEMNMGTGKPAPCRRDTLRLKFPENGSEAGAFFLQTAGYAVIDPGSGRKIRMRFDESFSRLVFWAVKGKPFLCVEPINSSPNGLATGDCLHLAPGAVREAELSFEAID